MSDELKVDVFLPTRKQFDKYFTNFRAFMSAGLYLKVKQQLKTKNGGGKS